MGEEEQYSSSNHNNNTFFFSFFFIHHGPSVDFSPLRTPGEVMDDDDAIALPSLLLAEHHTGQRDHTHNLFHRQHQHQHQHAHLHRKRQAVGDIADTVVEVVTTVAVVQEIDVDSSGSTFSSELLPTSDLATLLTLPIVAPVTSALASILSSNLLPSSTAQSSSDLPATSSPSSTAVTTSTPSVPIPTSSSFASLQPNSNSSISTQSPVNNALSQSQIFKSSNSSATLSSSISSSAVPTSHKYSTSSTGDLTTSSLTFLSASQTPVSTDAGGFLNGGIGTAVAPGSEASSTPGAGPVNNSSAPPTPVIIGSVVSGVAGAAFLILAILYVWRWRKRSGNMQSWGSTLLSSGPDTAPEAIRDAPSPSAPAPSARNMEERRTFAYAFPAALAGLTGYKRFSQRTETGTVSSSAGSERGFYRVSGRKLPSALRTGGDGYGDGYGDEVGDMIDRQNTLSEASFYRDSSGFFGGVGSPALQNPTQRDSGIPVMRPSPARTPVTEQGFFTAPPTLTPPPIIPDFVGRSHSSHDGSHTSHISKFTEEV